MNAAISLRELNERVSVAVSGESGLRDVWVTGEVNDLRVTGGHCYMELIEKDASGRAVARLRAIIWASAFGRIGAEFYSATGQRLASDMKIMARVSVNFHPVFGLSAVISGIDPSFTCGDIVRRRMMMIQRLTEEGIIDMNRTLPMPETPLRLAIISAKGAAGYGDFVTQIYNNSAHLRFTTQLFEAVMQGENAPASIIGALEEIASRGEEFDFVVIIRGGGATGDLAAFDNYDLAANVAQFPIPIIVGVGHERDETLLDHVAAVRVKTPTAAAEWLVERGEQALEGLRGIMSEIMMAANDKMMGALQQLAYYRGLLPGLSAGKAERTRRELDTRVGEALEMCAKGAMERQKMRLEAIGDLLNALSPQRILQRGYAIVRKGGHVVKDVSVLAVGDVVETEMANGLMESKILEKR